MRGLIVGNVLIDNGSAINVCPLVTLSRIGIDSSSIVHMPMAIRAFDGSHRQTMGMVEIPITIGPILFQIQFQVQHISSTYNLLLGHLWIHSSGSVPSSLHQCVKFILDNHLETIKVKREFSVSQAPTVPFVGLGVEAKASIFQTFELVSTIHIPSKRGVPDLDALTTR